MSARGWALATAAFGLVTLAVSAGFALLPEMAAARECLPAGAVIQFELARDHDDLLAIFGAADSGCRPLAVAAMDAVNTLDVWAFIPAYVLFCIAGALYLADGALLRPLAFAACAAALLAGVADYLETTTLLAITRDIENAEPLLAYSQLGAWAKFALLAAHALFCAGLAYLSAPRRPILSTLLILPTFGVAATAYDHVAFTQVLSITFGLAWLGLLAMAIRDALTRRPQATRTI